MTPPIDRTDHESIQALLEELHSRELDALTATELQELSSQLRSVAEALGHEASRTAILNFAASVTERLKRPGR